MEENFASRYPDPFYLYVKKQTWPSKNGKNVKNASWKKETKKGFRIEIQRLKNPYESGLLDPVPTAMNVI